METEEQITGVDDLSDFPVNPFYKDHIQEARTISRKGGYWSAVLLIENPSTGKQMLYCYRWQRKDGKWVQRKSFNCNSKNDAVKVVQIIQELTEKMD